MKKVFISLCIFSLLFVTGCASSKKEAPVVPEQELTQEDITPVEENPSDSDLSAEETEQSENEEQLLQQEEIQAAEELPLPEEVEIFEEEIPEIPEVEAEDVIQEEEPQLQEEEFFEISEEETAALNKLPAEEIPQGFIAENKIEQEEEPLAESSVTVNVEELTAPVETAPADSVQEETEEEEDLSGISDDVEVEDVVEEEEEIIPSRTAQILTKQYLDVTYPGTGWVYLGETGNNELLKYQGRKVENSQTTFTLRSVAEGITTLHFYKNDILTGKYIDDFLEVTISGTKAEDTKHVIAPSYADIVPERLLSSENENNASEDDEIEEEINLPQNKPKSEFSTENYSQKHDVEKVKEQNRHSSVTKHSDEDFSGQTKIQQTESSSSQNGKNIRSANKTSLKEEKPVETESEQKQSFADETENLSAEELLDEAKKSFARKEYAKTLNLLDSFFDKTVIKVDEGLYLRGQTLEAKSEVRNIKAALEAYETIVNKYPQSTMWSKANERITYLKRFYFNIR